MLSNDIAYNIEVALGSSTDYFVRVIDDERLCHLQQVVKTSVKCMTCTAALQHMQLVA